MAVIAGTVHSVEIVRASHTDPYQIARVLFTLSGTYVQADNAILQGVGALIAASLRNGKTITLAGGAMLGQLARKASDPSIFLGLKTVAISGSDVTFEVTLSSVAGVPNYSTEFTDATALPEQSSPFAIDVGFAES